MNHQLWNKVAARVIALAFVVAGVAACHDRISDVSSGTPAAAPVDASAKVIGTAPANPTGDPPGTTPIAPNTTDVTKQEETKGGPKEGDNHSYSSVAPDNKQKSENADPQQQPGRSKQ